MDGAGVHSGLQRITHLELLKVHGRLGDMAKSSASVLRYVKQKSRSFHLHPFHLCEDVLIHFLLS